MFINVKSISQKSVLWIDQSVIDLNKPIIWGVKLEQSATYFNEENLCFSSHSGNSFDLKERLLQRTCSAHPLTKPKFGNRSNLTIW